VKPQFLNAPQPIVFKVLGKWRIPLKLAQPKNAWFPIDRILSGIIKSPNKLEHPLKALPCILVIVVLILIYLEQQEVLG
jgi:hypothetical protein